MTTTRQPRRTPPLAGKQSGAHAETSQDATRLAPARQGVGTTLYQAHERRCSVVPGHACECPAELGCPLGLDQGAEVRRGTLCDCGRTKGPGARRCGSCLAVSVGGRLP